jgi:uncharacterized membrane protein
VPVSPSQQRALRIAQANWVALLVLCVAWEAWLAPLRPGGTWLVLKALPVVVLLRGVWRAEVRALQWAVLVAPFYIAEAAVRLWDPAPYRWCAALELVGASAFDLAALVYLRPFKHAAQARRAREHGR